MFHGLAIEKLWDESRTYKVLRLDFSGIPCSSREIFEKAAVRKFFLCAADAGLLDESCAPGDFHSISYLIDAICRRCGENPFVLLVDEYDAPIAANADSPEKLAGIRQSLGYFYDAVKANSGSFRLVFITGTAGFGELVRMVRSSAVVDLSDDPVFRDLLGFTEGEIRQFFRGYLIRSAALLNHMPLQDVTEQHIDILMDELRRHYGGYCFAMKGRSRVFQTWSVLNFLNQSSEPGFGDYWYETGVITDSMKEYFAARIGTPGKAQTKAFWECDFSASQYSPAIDTGVLLTQCGYYTILSGDGDVIEIGLPNLELKQAHARIVMDGIMPASVRREMRERLPFFTGAVKAADAAYFFNVFLTALPEARKPGTAGEVCDWLRIFLLSRGLDARSGEYGTDASAWLLCEFPDVGIIMGDDV